jgi:competence protein ComEC
LTLIIVYFDNDIFLKSYVTVIDVGQGDSILIHINNNNILIDTGGKVSYNNELWRKKDSSGVTEYTTIPLLKSLGIRELDYLLITHGDYDHMGEAKSLIKDFKVSNVIFNCGSYNELENDLIKELTIKNIKYYSCINSLNIDKYKLDFLNTMDYDNENDNSSVIYFDYNSYKFLFMGDAGCEKEKDILDKYNLRDIDFLKVGHHGSNTSTSKEFIDIIKPKYSVISVGLNNRYNHPKEEVLDILKNTKIYRTDFNGSIEISLSKDKYNIRTYNP